MGELAKAWTHGLQSPRPSLLNASRELLQTVVTLKHFAVNSLENSAPWSRHTFDANATFGVGRYVLSDYYLRPFKAAIEGADARGIMCSYNSVLNTPSCLSPLLRNARRQWGFQGYVTSDTDSIADATTAHHYSSSAEEATALALTAGQCDINSGSTYRDSIPQALAARTRGLAMADVDRALSNALKQRFDLGLFEPHGAYEWPGRDDIGTDESRALSLRASRESLVLLRNDAVLPLPRGRRVAVVGPHATARKLLVQPYPSMVSHFPAAMIWCPDNGTDCIQSPFEAIAAINGNTTAAAASSGSTSSGGASSGASTAAPVRDGGWTRTAPGCDVFAPSQRGFAAALALAAEADHVVIGLGISDCGPDSPIDSSTCYKHSSTSDYEFPDGYIEMEAHDRTEIGLPPVQKRFATAVLALGKPTVVFLLNGGAVAIDALAKHRANGAGGAPLAIIEAMYPGQLGAQALAEGIFGEMNAWGRLPYTIYPSSFSAETPMAEHDLRVAPGRTYRYYRDPLFAFGTGLSLTKWEVNTAETPSCLAELRTAAPDASCTVRLTVSNVGQLAGDVVVLAYFKVERSDAQWAARHKGANRTLLAPLKQLFDYTRVKAVAAAASAAIEFEVTAAMLALVDEESGDLVSDAASYTLMFDDGSGGRACRMAAKVSGERAVVDPFPSA